MSEIRTRGAVNVGVFHLGDEIHTAELDFYLKTDYTLRHYYHPEIFQLYRNVIWIPNGYAKGVGPRNIENLTKASMRQTPCYFEGRSTQLREDFSKVVTDNKTVVPCEVALTRTFGLGKNRADFATKLQDTIFAPCPSGNTPETIRFYDALECGAIPVMIGSDFTDFLLTQFPEIPEPIWVVTNWEEFAQKMPAYLKDRDLLDSMQEKSIMWWKHLKDSNLDLIRKTIDTSFFLRHQEPA